MSSGSNIEWTDSTWNPVVGCTKVSDGCRNCYAMTMAQRVAAAGDVKMAAGEKFSTVQLAYMSVVKRDAKDRPLPQWNNTVVCVDGQLTLPLSWRKPRRVFVNSMSDLFHEDVPFEFIDKVFAVMALAPHHTFQVLTKRPGRMVEYLSEGREPWLRWLDAVGGMITDRRVARAADAMKGARMPFPLPNVWLGVSVEDQAAADARIPLLLRVPAAVRFLSVEPMLGAVKLLIPQEAVRLANAMPSMMTMRDRAERMGLTREQLLECENTSIDWVIVGGESGPGARPCDVAWVRSVVAQCKFARVPCFVKQLGGHVLCANDRVEDWLEEVGGELGYFDLPSEAQVYQGMPLRMRLADRKGGDMAEWPDDLRVREFPKGGV